MGSQACTRYRQLSGRATVILKADRKKLDRAEVQALYGAAFLAQVAAWNAYVAGLADCFYQCVADPVVAKYRALHSLAQAGALAQVEKFNTPNAEKSRELIVGCTGYDPWNDWQWPARGMNALATRLRLNEILKVRHSLAHGSAMPAYNWNQSPSGQTRLTLQAVDWTRSFLNHLVAMTDRGLSSHIVATFGVPDPW